jgi:hypothetical protein
MMWASAAAADEPITALPATIPDTTIPALNCVEPNLSDLSKATLKELKVVTSHIQVYRACMQHYIDDRHAKTSEYVNLQKAEVDAGNAAVKAVNAFFAQLRELQNKQRSQTASKDTPQ